MGTKAMGQAGLKRVGGFVNPGFSSRGVRGPGFGAIHTPPVGSRSKIFSIGLWIMDDCYGKGMTLDEAKISLLTDGGDYAVRQQPPCFGTVFHQGYFRSSKSIIFCFLVIFLGN